MNLQEREKKLNKHKQTNDDYDPKSEKKAL